LGLSADVRTLALLVSAYGLTRVVLGCLEDGVHLLFGEARAVQERALPRVLREDGFLYRVGILKLPQGLEGERAPPVVVPADKNVRALD